MPKLNIVKIYAEDEYYHIYNRGNNKQNIFLEQDDYYYFINLFKRYLSLENSFDKLGRPFKKYYEEVNLVAYCLMPNHFHLLCYLKDTYGIVHLMRGVMTSYAMYFNKKYKRTGKLTEGIFLAARINSDPYLWQVSRYIHLNPLDIGLDFWDYKYSSIESFLTDKGTNWLHSGKLIETKEEKQSYRKFLSDYDKIHREIKALNKLLALPD